MAAQQNLQVKAGRQFGRLEVLDPDVRITTEKNPRGVRAALCLCKPDLGGCGTRKTVRLHHLLSGSIQSCGCLRNETHTKHGFARREAMHPLYQTWALMMNRCYNPDSKDYPDWGGRGITVHPDWHDVTAYITWIEKNLGPRPGSQTAGGRPEYTIDRIDNNGNYEPGKIRWATHTQQVRNSHPTLLREQRIRMARELQAGGLSQREIAAALGVVPTAVSGYLPVRSIRSRRFGGTAVADRAREARDLQAAGKPLAEIAVALRVRVWTARRYLSNDHPAGEATEAISASRSAAAAERAAQVQAARDLRATGMSQVEIAAELGIGQTTVSRYLRQG